jgi:hypothetical protein
MSEKQQHTAASMRETMLHRYDDGRHHKHDKCHLPYRQHCRSHPIGVPDGIKLDEEKILSESTGHIRERNLQKIRKRFDKGRVH